MLYSSEHITIAELAATDALQLNKLLVSNTERFIRYLPKTLAENRTLANTKSYIEKKIEATKTKEEFVFVIKDKYAVQIAGLVILKNLDWEAKQGEFAYCIGKQFKGKGLMSEAIKATCNFAMTNLGLKTLQILSHKSNLGSVNVAVNSGFIWKETLPQEFKPLNEPALDMELYELKKT